MSNVTLIITKVWEYYQRIENATIFYAPANAASMTIDNLYKNRNYRLRVQGWSVGGEGKLSIPLKEFRIDNDGRLLISKWRLFVVTFFWLGLLTHVRFSILKWQVFFTMRVF